MTDTYTPSEGEFMSIGDVARSFDVTIATVRRWESAGKISAVRTPGNQRRFRRADVDALLAGGVSQ